MAAVTSALGASCSSSRERRVISASIANPQSSVTRSIGPSDAIDTMRASRWLRVLAWPDARV